MVNLKKSVFLFIGQDSYLKEKAIKDLSTSVLDSALKDLDYRIFYGADADVKDIIDYIATIPFFSSKRLAIVKNFERLSPESRSRLVNYIKKPATSTYLVLETSDDSMLKEHSDIIGNIEIRRFDAPVAQGLITWMKRFVAAEGKEIDADALLAIRQMHGQDLQALTQELKKLVTFVGNRNVIMLGDVEEVVGRSIIVSAFDLTEAIEHKDIDRAIRIVSDLMRAGKKHHEIVGLLCWHLKRIFKAKALQLKGASDSEIANTLRIGRRYSADFFKQLKISDILKIKSQIAVLLEADLDIKRTKYDPALILEFALIRLCLGGR